MICNFAHYPHLASQAQRSFVWKNHNIIFLFGGYDGDEDQPSSKLIAIGVDRLIWRIVEAGGQVEGGNITPRVNPAMTVTAIGISLQESRTIRTQNI